MVGGRAGYKLPLMLATVDVSGRQEGAEKLGATREHGRRLPLMQQGVCARDTPTPPTPPCLGTASQCSCAA